MSAISHDSINMPCVLKILSWLVHTFVGFSGGHISKTGFYATIVHEQYTHRVEHACKQDSKMPSWHRHDSDYNHQGLRQTFSSTQHVVYTACLTDITMLLHVTQVKSLCYLDGIVVQLMFVFAVLCFRRPSWRRPCCPWHAVQWAPWSLVLWVWSPAWNWAQWRLLVLLALVEFWSGGNWKVERRSRLLMRWMPWVVDRSSLVC